jgi:protein TonB
MRGFIFGAVVGAAVTVGLFFLMQELIKSEKVQPEEQANTGPIDIVGEPPEDPDIETRQPLDRPDETEEPDTPPLDKPEFTEPNDREGINIRSRPVIPVPEGPIGRPERGEPTPIVRLSPNYPDRAQRQGLEGDVLVEFDIDEGGNVVNARVISSTNSVFERAAIRAVSRWKYAPQIVNGQPVVRRNIRVTIEFRLDEED